MALNLRQIPNIWMQEVGLDPTDTRSTEVNGLNGGIDLVYPITIPDAATGNVDIGPLPYAIRVYDVVVIKTGGAGGAANTVQLFNGATAVSDAIDINIADKAVARAATLDDASWSYAAGDTLRVTRTKAGGNAACVVRVKCFRV